MEKKNVSSISTIFCMRFQTSQSIRFSIFFLFLMIYCITVCGNLLILIMVSYSKSLHSPMYFFLSQLALADILLTTVILPNTLHVLLRKETIISLYGCIFQFFFFCFPGGTECLLLTLMCYDRYMAICKPLHYNITMTFQFCCIMSITCWVLSVLLALIIMFSLLNLQFCGPYIIDHFFCDLQPILQLSCSDTSIIHLEVKVMNFSIVVTPFFIIIISYVYIVVTIFKIPSITGRQKVFSTCSSHLTVVCIYYGNLICVYLIPRSGQSWDIGKFLSSLLYTVVTPLMNPIIYSLRNIELKLVLDKIISHCLHSPFSK